METFESRQMRAGLLRKLRDCFIYNPDHTLVLSSGRKSNFFIDCRRVTLDPDGALLVGRLVLAAAQSDMGRIIGKQGRTAKAMRTYVIYIGSCLKFTLQLSVSSFLFYFLLLTRMYT